MNRVFFMTLIWYRSWYLLREVTWESVYDTFRKASFCMKKMVLPASSYDAASTVGKKLSIYIGFWYVVNFEIKESYPKNSATGVVL